MGMNLGEFDPNLNFKLGAGQVDRLYLGRAYVWPNHPITDFSASDNRVKEIQITFTDPNNPLPVDYDLFQGSVKVMDGVVSGEVYDAVAGTDDYHVVSNYEAGHIVSSNIDSGTALSGILPSKITDFEASDDQQFQVQSWWTNATGDPTPVYDIYEDTQIRAQNVASGVIIAAEEGTKPWHVVARNAEGEVSSNIDNGTALGIGIPPPTPIVVDFYVDGELYVPEGYTSAEVCMIGGGGGGGDAGGGNNVGGGYAGTIVNEIVAVSEGTYPVVVGIGGIGGTDFENGINGTESIILGLTAGGGIGGNRSINDYAGNGLQQPPNCIGQYYDGIAQIDTVTFSGGQAGFGNGGAGKRSASVGENDAEGHGAGGGANGTGETPGDNGGGSGSNGYIKVTLT